jgi:hypothetical protein
MNLKSKLLMIGSAAYVSIASTFAALPLSDQQSESNHELAALRKSLILNVSA